MGRTRIEGEAEPPTVTTTLYQLIAALQDCVTVENDDLLVAVVHHWIGTGRIKVLKERCEWQRGADSPATPAWTNPSPGPVT